MDPIIIYKEKEVVIWLFLLTCKEYQIFSTTQLIKTVKIILIQLLHQLKMG